MLTLILLTYLTISTITADLDITGGPYIYINGYITGRKVSKSRCVGDFELPVDHFRRFEEENGGKVLSFVEFSWRYSAKSGVFGFLVHVTGSGNDECVLIEVSQDSQLEENNNSLFNITYLPTNVSQVTEISVAALPNIKYAYNKHTSKLQIRILKEINANLYKVSIVKNPNGTCVQGNVIKTFQFVKEETHPRPDIWLNLKPESGNFCIRVKPIRLSSFSSDVFQLTSENEVQPASCVYDGEIKDWNITILLHPKPENSSVKVTLALMDAHRYTCLKTFTVTLHVNSSTGCIHGSYVNSTTLTNPVVETTFTNLAYGNYCVRVSPICRACNDASPRYSNIEELSPLVGTDPQTFAVTSPSTMKLSTILSIIGCITVLFIIILGFIVWRRRKRHDLFNFPYYVTENTENIIRKVEIMSRKKKKKILLVYIAVNNTFQMIMKRFIEVLEKNYFCEVLIADVRTVTNLTGKLNLTIQFDAIDEMMKRCDRVIFIKPNVNVESSLEAKSEEQSVFLMCRQTLIARFSEKMLRKNVAVVEIIAGTEPRYPILANLDISTYTLPLYFAHLFGFVHDVNGDVLDENKFAQFWESSSDSPLNDFKLFLQNNSSVTTISQGVYNTLV